MPDHDLTHAERHFDLRIGVPRPASPGYRPASAAVPPAAWAALGELLGDGAAAVIAVLPGWLDRVFSPVPLPSVLPAPPEFRPFVNIHLGRLREAE